jgi:hypothetical protein
MRVPKKITNAHDINSDIKCLLRVISHYIFITAVLQSFGNILLKTFVPLNTSENSEISAVIYIAYIVIHYTFL